MASFLSYGGVNLDIVHTLEFSTTPVYDQQSRYLYTRTRIIVQAVFNPLATSYSLNGGIYGLPLTLQQSDANVPAALPAAPPGRPPTTPQPAPTTLAAVKHVLSQSRRRLVYQVGGVRFGDPNGMVIVDSPKRRSNADPDPCVDAANGPVVLEAPMVFQVTGTQFMHVRFAVETYINDATNTANGSNPLAPVILSHVWEASEDIDPDYYATRIIRGRILLRGDAAKAVLVKPDYFREKVVGAHQVQPFFKRDKVFVVATDDGLGLDYLIIDREQTYTILYQDITRIEASQTSGAGRPDMPSNPLPLSGLWSSIPAWGRGILGLFGLGGAGNAANNAIGGVPGALAAGGMNYIMNVRLPTTYHHYEVRVWGQNGVSSRKQLARAAHSILARRLAITTPTRVMYAADLRQREDLNGLFVEVMADFMSSGTSDVVFAGDYELPWLGTFFGSDGGTSEPDNNETRMGRGNDIAYSRKDTVAAGGATFGQGAGRLSVNGAGTRGAFQGALLAQALQDPEPSTPPPLPIGPLPGTTLPQGTNDYNQLG